MSEKITIEVSDLSKVSDGYHTVAELYDHRQLLWIALALQPDFAATSFLIRDHLEGWDLIVHHDYREQTQEQPYLHGDMSYHVQIKFRPLYEGKLTEVAKYTWDGHTSNDVLTRLVNICKLSKGAR